LVGLTAKRGKKMSGGGIRGWGGRLTFSDSKVGAIAENRKSAEGRYPTAKAYQIQGKKGALKPHLKQRGRLAQAKSEKPSITIRGRADFRRGEKDLWEGGWGGGGGEVPGDDPDQRKRERGKQGAQGRKKQLTGEKTRKMRRTANQNPQARQYNRCHR